MARFNKKITWKIAKDRVEFYKKCKMDLDYLMVFIQKKDERAELVLKKILSALQERLDAEQQVVDKGF